MPLKTRDGREVVDFEIEHGDDSCDSFFTHAVYLNPCPTCGRDGEQVPEHVLEELTEDYPEVLDESWFEAQVGRAEAYYEGDR